MRKRLLVAVFCPSFHLFFIDLNGRSWPIAGGRGSASERPLYAPKQTFS